MLYLIIIFVAITLALFAFISVVALVTKLADTKTVAITIFSGIGVVAVKFLYNLTDTFMNGAAFGKTEARNAILLAIALILGATALFVVFMVDKYYKNDNNSSG